MTVAFLLCSRAKDRVLWSLFAVKCLVKQQKVWQLKNLVKEKKKKKTKLIPNSAHPLNKKTSSLAHEKLTDF